MIGALRVSLSAETAQFEAGMKRAQRTAHQTNSSFKKAFGGLGATVKGGLAGLVSGLSLGLLAQGIKGALNYAGSLGEVAQQLGVTARELQEFRYAAMQNGATLEQADQALGKFAIAISKARAGSKQAAEAFGAMGVKLSDLESKGKTELIGQIADHMKATGGASANAAAGVAIFGRGFQKIVPLLDQGSAGMNALRQAANDLGMVLDDKLINQADEAADKVDALQTILKAQIAGAVAQNADAIVGLANALIFLVDKIGGAITAWRDFRNALDAQGFDLASKNPFLSKAKRAEGAERAAMSRGKISDSGIGWKVGGSRVIVELAPATKPAPRGTGSPTKFLGGGGGGGRRTRPERNPAIAPEELASELRRAEMDILRAKQSLAHDYVERTALSVQILNIEKEEHEAGLQSRIAKGELNKAQAQQLRAAFEQRDAADRLAVLEQEEADRQRDYNRLEAVDFELARDELERKRELATTSADRRTVEMSILELAYREERERLNRIVQESKDWAEIEEARRRLLALSQSQSADREIARRNTMGPMESAQFEFGDLSEEMESLRVNGIMAAGDALATLATEGFGSFKEQAIGAIKAVIAEFIRLQTIKMLFNVLGSATGGGGGFNAGSFGSTVSSNASALGAIPMNIPGFATGGGFNVLGNHGIDKNLLSLNGLPIAKISHGERVSIDADSSRPGGGGGMTVSNHFTISGPVTRQTEMQIAAAARRGIASANRKGLG